MCFVEKTYNIPVTVWLEENYPQSAPICYVTPTREMLLLRGNYISMDSLVTIPYLDEWKAVSGLDIWRTVQNMITTLTAEKWLNTLFFRQSECNLMVLLQVMSAVFGEAPPVCMKSQPEPQQIPCKWQSHGQKWPQLKNKNALVLVREQ